MVEASGDGLAEARDGVGGALQRVSGDLAENGFKFSEHLFNWVEVGAVGGEVDKNGAARFDGFLDAGDLMNRDIVHEHDVTFFQGWSQNLFDIGPERLAVHRAFEHKRRGDPIVAQCSDECRGLPIAVQHLLGEALSARGAAVEAGDGARDTGFIDENEPPWIKLWLPSSQSLAIGRDVRPVLLCGVQAFF